jgi:replicative DNA helicase
MENNQSSKQDIAKKKNRRSPLNQSIFEQGKLPPQAVDVEEAVLGALMLEKDPLHTVIDKLKPETFYHDGHQIIYKAIQNLFSKSEPVDIITVTNELKKMGQLEIVGGPYYITQLTNRVASAANIEYHTSILIEKYLLRELIHSSSDIIKDAYDSSTDAFDLLDKAERELFDLSENNLRSDYKDIQSLVREAIAEIEKAKDFESHLSGVPSGFTELDRVTSGWQKSNLIVIAARPGMGKTALVLSMAKNIAVDFKKPVAFFSLEMSSIELVTRLISSESHLPSEKLKKGNLEPHEWTQLNTRIKKLVDAPLYIDDTPALTIFELRAKSRRLKAQFGIEAIIIDYLQLMSGESDKNRGGNREQEISLISRSLKALAKELKVPVIALSQLSRATESRGGNKKPILSDLRESGAIEQDADMVIFIYRPEYYGLTEMSDGSPSQGLAELIVAKHRNGPLRDVSLRFIDYLAKFEDIEKGIDDFTADLVPNETFEQAGKSGRTVTRQSKLNDVDSEDENPF